MKIYQAEIMRHMLALAGENVPLEEIIEWTPKQVQQAENWAAMQYAKSSGNASIRVPPKPGFLTQRAPDGGYVPPRPGLRPGDLTREMNNRKSTRRR